MTNLMDYLDWRGDLSFAASPFNEVDNLILAELAFLHFEGIVPTLEEGGSVSLFTAAQAYFERHGEEKIDMGVLVPDAIVQMLEKLAACLRFRGLLLSCYQSHLDTVRAQQFAALTIEVGDSLAGGSLTSGSLAGSSLTGGSLAGSSLAGSSLAGSSLAGSSLYIAFRGTDDTLVGWKEDFRMTFLERVPSQDTALRYLTEVAKRNPRKKLRIGGHSKGGNLAVFSAVNCGALLQHRILQVYNNDGPGFLKAVVGTPGHTRIAERILTIVPKGSMVGMLMSHEENFTVVDSSAIGLYQHDGFSWGVRGSGFLHLDDAAELRRNDLTMKAWIAGMSAAQRETFTDALFEILSSGDAKTLTDLKSDPLKSAAAMLKAMVGLDKEMREALEYAVRLFFVSGAKVLGDDIRDSVEEIRGGIETDSPKKWNPLKRETKKSLSIEEKRE